MNDEKLEFGGHEVMVSTSNLKFDEMTLSVYIQKESGFYDNFGGYLALAERNLHNKEVKLEQLYASKFVEAKEQGGSDKLAEARAKSDMEVSSLKAEIVEAKYVVNRLKQHLKAWDKNHDNAQSLGHMLRKQMDKLHGDIMASPGMDQRLQNIVGDSGSTETKTGFSDDLGLSGLV